MFLQVSVILSMGGGGCAWLLGKVGAGVRGCLQGGMHGCSWGACMVARGGMHGCSGGHAWLLGGMHGCSGGCVVVPGGMHGCLWGGMHGCSRGVHGCSRGASMVAHGGHAWLLVGGACMVAHRGHAWLLLGGGGMCGFFNEIRSMSGRYASYWNAFLLCIRWDNTLCLIVSISLI